jgi:hypothetical protein
MKLGLKYAQEKLNSNQVQNILPAIQANPKPYDFVNCQICGGNGADKTGGECGVCLGFSVIPKGWWLDWDHPLDLMKKPPHEECYNVTPLIDIVSVELHGWYFQFEKCYNCALDRENPVPECINICRFKVRPRGAKNGPIQVIDTKRDFPPGVATPYGTLLIARAMLDFNYRLGLPFIIRNGKGNSTELDHILGVPWDDRPGHYRLTTKHRIIEGHKRTHDVQMKHITELNQLYGFTDKQFDKLVHGQKRYKKLIDAQEPDSSVWKYIFDMYEVVSMFKLYGQVPDVLRQKIESYYKI